MEIKIQCSCGTKYKFDVEPENGQMPFAVNCPTCGLSGTEAANGYIQQTRSPAAADNREGAAPIPTSGGASKLRIARFDPQPASAAAENPVEPTPSATLVAAPPPLARPIPRVATLNPVREEEGVKSLGLGLVGGILGAVLGAVLYYLVFHQFGVRVKLLALAVGFLAGLGARLLGKEGSTELAVVAATLSIAAIVGTQYIVAQHWFHEIVKESANALSYTIQLAEAKHAVEVIPNGSDEEIRNYLAKQEADPGEQPDPRSVSNAEVKEFREQVLPGLRDLATGKVSQEDFERAQKSGGEPANPQKEKEETERTFKWIFVALTFSKFNLVCLAGAAGIAYKMNAGA